MILYFITLHVWRQTPKTVIIMKTTIIILCDISFTTNTCNDQWILDSYNIDALRGKIEEAIASGAIFFFFFWVALFYMANLLIMNNNVGWFKFFFRSFYFKTVAQCTQNKERKGKTQNWRIWFKNITYILSWNPYCDWIEKKKIFVWPAKWKFFILL